MVKVKSDGAYTVVRKARKDSGARGTMHKDNLDEALTRGSGNVIMMDADNKKGPANFHPCELPGTF